ncbi:MAG: hypothetical protein MUC86_17425 [Burkholderiaceae bacterium]|nr:hypothetical protein [Burkholderiaceae bacterium]
MPIEPPAAPARKPTSKALLLLLLLVASAAATAYVRPDLVSALVGTVMARLPLP